jgi:hypothetical protein
MPLRKLTFFWRRQAKMSYINATKGEAWMEGV